MDFTLEDAVQTEQIVEMYVNAFQCGEEMDLSRMDYTRGHFKRGVK